MKIRGKIFVWIMSTTFVFFLLMAGFLGLKSRTASLEKAKELTDTYAELSAANAKNILDSDMAVVRTLANFFEDYERLPYKQRMKYYNELLRTTLQANQRFLSVWVSWELSALDPAYEKPFGRLRSYYLKVPGGKIEHDIDTPNLDGDNPASTYYKLKTSTDREHTVDPYYYTYKTEKVTDSVFETSLAVQIRASGEFKGLVGIDAALRDLQNIIDTELPFEESYMSLIANNGDYIAHPDEEMVGVSVAEVFSKDYASHGILEKISVGNSFSLSSSDSESETYTSFVPIYIGESKTPWSVSITVPLKSVTEEAMNNLYLSLLVGVIGFAILALIIFLVSENITNPLHKTIEVLHKLDSGDISVVHKLNVNRKDEMGDMAQSVNKLIDTLNATAEFAVNIGQTKLDVEYQSLGERDILGNALLEMRKNLKAAEEERQERIREAEERTWLQNGVTEISDILRVSYDSIADLSYNLIKSIVKQLNAAQGGMFVLEGSGKDERYTLQAAYAFDRKKRLEGDFQIGEGLIGRVAQEKKFLQLTEVPEGYTFISSGLGEEKPRVLVLLPLIHEQKTFGIIEIAGFKQFEEHQINFMKTIGQRIASVISNIRANIETKELLAQFREQSEKLAMKEFESLQTNVELKRAQQNLKQHENTQKAIEKALSNKGYIAYFDNQGVLKNISRSGKDIFGFTDDSKDVSFTEMHSNTGHNPQWLKSFWQGLQKGNISKKESSLLLNNKRTWYSETYFPVIDENGKIDTVICLGIDISKAKVLEQQLNKK